MKSDSSILTNNLLTESNLQDKDILRKQEIEDTATNSVRQDNGERILNLLLNLFPYDRAFNDKFKETDRVESLVGIRVSGKTKLVADSIDRENTVYQMRLIGLDIDSYTVVPEERDYEVEENGKKVMLKSKAALKQTKMSYSFDSKFVDTADFELFTNLAALKSIIFYIHSMNLTLDTLNNAEGIAVKDRHGIEFDIGLFDPKSNITTAYNQLNNKIGKCLLYLVERIDRFDQEDIDLIDSLVEIYEKYIVPEYLSRDQITSPEVQNLSYNNRLLRWSEESTILFERLEALKKKHKITQTGGTTILKYLNSIPRITKKTIMDLPNNIKRGVDTVDNDMLDAIVLDECKTARLILDIQNGRTRGLIHDIYADTYKINHQTTIGAIIEHWGNSISQFFKRSFIHKIITLFIIPFMLIVSIYSVTRARARFIANTAKREKLIRESRIIINNREKIIDAINTNLARERLKKGV